MTVTYSLVYSGMATVVVEVWPGAVCSGMTAARRFVPTPLLTTTAAMYWLSFAVTIRSPVASSFSTLTSSGAVLSMVMELVQNAPAPSLPEPIRLSSCAWSISPSCS